MKETRTTVIRYENKNTVSSLVSSVYGIQKYFKADSLIKLKL